MKHSQYCVVSGLFFCLVALAHLLRIIYGLQVQIDDVVVPMVVSWVGFILPAAFAFWAFRVCRH